MGSAMCIIVPCLCAHVCVLKHKYLCTSYYILHAWNTYGCVSLCTGTQVYHAGVYEHL